MYVTERKMKMAKFDGCGRGVYLETLVAEFYRNRLRFSKGRDFLQSPLDRFEHHL